MDQRMEIKENREIEKFVNLAREMKKVVDYEGESITKNLERARNSPQGLKNKNLNN